MKNKKELTLERVFDAPVEKVLAIIHDTGPDAQMAVQGTEAGFTQQLNKLTNFLFA